MTNEELDELIFKLQGWVKLQSPAYPKWQHPGIDGTKLWFEDYIPSPTTDPRCAMELLKEMSNCALKRWGDKWCCGIYNDKGYLENQANMYDTPERAISEAYAQWKGAE